jgi:hypothetical protein
LLHDHASTALATFIGMLVGVLLLHAGLPFFAFQRLGWSPDDDRGWSVVKCRMSAGILAFFGLVYGAGMVVVRVLGVKEGSGAGWWPNVAAGLGVAVFVACTHKAFQLWGHSSGASPVVPPARPTTTSPSKLPPRQASPGKVRLQF